MKKALKRLLFLPLTTPLSKRDTVIILRLDNIGDYILFRNFLSEIRFSEAYKDKKLILVGNIVWKTLAEQLDAAFINQFVWIDTKKYYKNWQYRLHITLKIKQLAAYEIINPAHSHTFLQNEIVQISGAKIRTSSQNDGANIAQNSPDTNIYNRIIASLPENNFEFWRNKFFFENLLEKNINISKPSIYINENIKPKTHIRIFPSAGMPSRQWHTQHFSELISRIAAKNPDAHFEILGTAEDERLAIEIGENLPKSIKIHSKCGKISLIEMMEHIAASHFIISNESAPVHIAAAVGTAAVCISNGNHFTRFTPYPLSIADNIFTIYPDDSFYDAQNNDFYAQKFKVLSDLDINTITPQRVWDFIKDKNLLCF